MLPIYNPVTKQFVATDGFQNDYLLLSILIELRVMNAMFLDAQKGQVTQTVDQYRSDVVNDTASGVAVPQ